MIRALEVNPERLLLSDGENEFRLAPDGPAIWLLENIYINGTSLEVHFSNFLFLVTFITASVVRWINWA